MNTETSKTQLQVKQRTYVYESKFKLDSHSLEALNFASEYHRTKDMPTSNSVVLRRALRVYSNYLKKLRTDEQRRREATELLRAAKGVI